MRLLDDVYQPVAETRRTWVNLMQRSMNVLALVKDSERYVFLYDDDSVAQLLQQLGRYAADRSLSFTWYDAAVLSQKVRRLREEAEAEEGHNRLRESA